METALPTAASRTSSDTAKATGFLVQIHPVDLRGELIPLSGDRFVLGRDPLCHLQLASEAASRFHAALERDNVGFEVSALKGASSLYVNHVRVPRAALRSGDRIQVGGQVFKFLTAARVEAEYQETLCAIRTHDGLTGLLNRLAFTEMLGRTAREGAPAALLLLEIDRFQDLRTTHGALAGDEVIQEVAHRLRSAATTKATVARLGETLFGVLLAGQIDAQALDVADRMRTATSARRFDASAGLLRVTLSGGLSIAASGTADSGPVDSAAWVRQAESLLQHAIAAGGDQLAADRLSAAEERPTPCFA